MVAYAVLLGLTGVVSFRRAAHVNFDFEHFCRDASYVWNHGELNPDLTTPGHGHSRRLAFYLPVVPLTLAPLAAGGPQPMALIWSCAHVLALGFTLRCLARRFSRTTPTSIAWPAFVLTCALIAPAVFEAAKFNQLTFVVLALLLAAVIADEDERPVSAGVFFALATILKLVPGLFVFWLVLKRRWRTLGVFVAASVVLTLAPPLMAWGPAKTVAYHRQWAEHNLAGVLSTGMAGPELKSHFADHRNQSIREVVRRLCEVDCPHPAPIRLANLSPRACGVIATGVSAALLGALLWLTRRPRRRLASVRLHAEASVYLIAMFVLAPLLRQYYLVWALPALYMLVCVSLRHEMSSAVRWSRVGVIAWIVGLALWASEAARSCGGTLLVLIVMAATLLIVIRGERPAGEDSPQSTRSAQS